MKLQNYASLQFIELLTYVKTFNISFAKIDPLTLLDSMGLF